MIAHKLHVNTRFSTQGNAFLIRKQIKNLTLFTLKCEICAEKLTVNAKIKLA